MLGSRKVVEEMRGVVGCGRIARDWEEWEEMEKIERNGRKWEEWQEWEGVIKGNGK